MADLPGGVCVFATQPALDAAETAHPLGARAGFGLAYRLRVTDDTYELAALAKTCPLDSVPRAQVEELVELRAWLGPAEEVAAHLRERPAEPMLRRVHPPSSPQRWYEHWFAPSGPDWYQVVSRDVTRTQIALRMGKLHTLVNHRVLAGHTMSDVIRQFCHELNDLLGLVGVWVGTRRADGSVGVAGAAGKAPELLQAALLRWDGPPERSGPMAAAIATGRPQILGPAELATIPHAAPLARLGVRTAVSLPISSDEEILGALTALAADPSEAPPILDALRDAAAWLGLGLIHARIRREAESHAAAIAHQAMHDPLTGLPNRALLLDRIQLALGRTHRGARAVGVVALDLDDFARINDVGGLGAGDRTLLAVARRLTHAIRAQDTVGRLAGDEFAVLLEDLPSDQALLDVMTRLSDAIAEVRPLPDDVGMQASMGVVLATPGDTTTAEALLRDAVVAMHRAKSHRRGGWELLDADLLAQLADRQQLLRELREGIAGGQLVVHYQPQVDLRNRALVGFEALVRWQHPTRGLLLPGAFLPLADESGLIGDIGRWVLQSVVEQQAQWRQDPSFSGVPTVSINLAAHDLAQPDLLERVFALLERTGASPGDLCIEVVEGALVSPGAEANLEGLGAVGVGVAVDDFGQGYSSLSYLERLPVSLLKIDRMFVEGLGRSASATTIVHAVVDLAHALGLRVLGEGVETERQASILRSIGCDLAQGWLFARAVPADEATELLRARYRWPHPADVP